MTEYMEWTEDGLVHVKACPCCGEPTGMEQHLDDGTWYCVVCNYQEVPS